MWTRHSRCSLASGVSPCFCTDSFEGQEVDSTDSKLSGWPDVAERSGNSQMGCKRTGRQKATKRNNDSLSMLWTGYVRSVVVVVQTQCKHGVM